LRGIDGFARIILEDYGPKLDDEGNRLLNIVCSEARRMGKLIDNLLNFSRLGRQPLEKTAINMTSLARSVFQELTRDVELPPHLELAALPPATADHSLFRQVFFNLLSNAIKFSSRRDNPLIQVGGSHSGGECTYFVRDNGAGFDDKYAHKLFGVFQRLHSESEFEGTGVGLALIRRIVQRHGGRVWAEGKAGQGAVFYFTVPNPKEEVS
jgi:light-regulated signal transduction histidine kinase (bacteriophytochrome)